MKNLTYRRDIDGLRAVAVGCVVIYHVFPMALPSGFVGVDVFFVISGFLISSIIARGLDAGSFSFADFYSRRIKRIFPALVAVLAFTYAVGWQLLLPNEFKQLGKQIAGGAGFASNLILLKEVGYFDTTADLKPLLHLWSLGIEEQFYIAWPVLLVAAYRFRVRLSMVAVFVGVVSFVVNVRLIHTNAAAAFYLPYSRAWQMAAGALLASAHTRPSQRLSDGLSIVGFIALAIAATCLGGDAIYPGWWALIPTAAAVALIGAGPNGLFNRVVLSSKPLVFAGLISFPLYLWHWPLLAFSRVAISGTPSPAVRCGLVIASFILAWLTYRLVEMPLRHGGKVRLKVVTLCAFMAVTGFVGANAYHRDGLAFRTIARTNQSVVQSLKWDYWTSAACVAKYGVEPCEISGANPETMVIGDSHANHLYPGLVKANPRNNVINVGTCWPLDDVIMGIEKNSGTWPCTNRDTFAFDLKVLESVPSVKTIVISGWWSPVLKGSMESADFKANWGSYSLRSNKPDESDLDRPELLFRGLSRALSYFEEKHLNVVLLPDTPFIYEDLKGYCELGSRFGLRSDCSIPRVDYERRRTEEMVVVTRLKAAHPKLVVFDPLPLFCDAKRCYLVRSGVVLFRDQTHLSLAGSDLIGANLSPVIEAMSAKRTSN